MKVSTPIPTLVINLAKDVDRMKSIVDQISKLDNFCLVRIEGVLGAELPLYAQRRLARRPKVVPGNLGCFLSHVKAWEHVANGAEWSLIMEDDAVLFRPHLILEANIPVDADLIFVNERCDPSSRRRDTERASEVLPMIELVRHKATAPKGSRQSVGGDGYLLSPGGASKLLDAIHKDNFVTLPDSLLYRYSLSLAETASIVSGTWLEGHRLISPTSSLPCSWNVITGYCLSPAAIKVSESFTSTRSLENLRDT